MNFTARNASSSPAPAAAATAGFSMGRRTLGVGLAATVLAAGAYAYTASNTFENGGAGHAGDGAAGISGYHVTDVQYTLGTNDPSTISGVSFTLDAAATTVKASTDNTDEYASCTATVDTNGWECTFTNPPGVQGAANLSVVAAN